MSVPGTPSSVAWRAVIERMNELGVTEAHIPVPGSLIEPWLEELRGWIMQLADKCQPGMVVMTEEEFSSRLADELERGRELGSYSD